MSKPVKYFLIIAASLAAVACVFAFMIVVRGFSARDEPTAIEAFMARTARRLAIPRDAYEAVNPITLSPEVLANGLAHFADHCAGCHANNGSGDTTIGRNLYPKSPDMREAPTQSLTDGELFYIINNGIRLTGMPAWGDGDADHNDAQDSHGTWALVHFIRHLPSITDDELAEMRSLNPTSPGHAAAAERERDGHESAPPAKKGNGHDHDHHH